ncbi:MAG: SUMF1/EgtB/PvdO family nonheme iron enzyme, partial [Planctomycetes bacterium]|nr:SUMF1/EgtB/PvdO family nonheme iron enzyme [Planctomycetota bacterium]
MAWAFLSSMAFSGLKADAPFIRGDVDGNSTIEITDAIRLFGFLFKGSPAAHGCLEAANANSDGDLDISDGVYILLFLFRDGPAPAAPFPGCGTDPAGSPLGCGSYPACGGEVETPIEPSGGTIEFQAEGIGQVTITIPQGVFGSTTVITADAGREPAPLMEGDDVPALAAVRLKFDGMRLNPNLTEETIEISLTAGGAGAGAGGGLEETLEDVAVFIQTSTHDYLYVFPVQSGPGGGGLERVIKVPAALFKKAREWAVIGKEAFVGATRVVVTEVKEAGKVVLDVGGQIVEGTIEFIADAGKAVIRVVIDGTERVIELVNLTVEVIVKALLNFAKTVYQRATATLATIIGPGELYRVSFPDLSLERVDGQEPDCGCRTVIVHGWDMFDPFWNALDLTRERIIWRTLVDPWTEDKVKERLKKKWSSLLDHLNRPGGTGVYLYTYNTSLSVAGNGQSFRAKLWDAFDWENRDCLTTFICHSMGGLVTSVALNAEFGLENELPPSIKVITLGTPFRGSPFANSAFQAYWTAQGIKAVLEVAQSTGLGLDPQSLAKLPVEVLGSLVGALTFFLTRSDGARDLDLDAPGIWPVVGQPGLSGGLVPAAGEIIGTGNSLALELGAKLLAAYSDNYARSDGVVPLYSAFRRQSATDNSNQKERLFRGEDHLSLPDSPTVFNAMGIGAGGWTNSIGMKLVWIPPGSFLMGSPDDERGHCRWEGPVHKVNLSKGFYMGATEVTQGEYLEVMGGNPSYFNGVRCVAIDELGECSEVVDYGNDLNRPVEAVSWFDALEFSRRLSEREGRTYTLPTEAQWEYAARAGTRTRFSFGDALECGDVGGCWACPLADEYLWWCGNSTTALDPERA